MTKEEHDKYEDLTHRIYELERMKDANCYPFRVGLNTQFPPEWAIIDYGQAWLASDSSVLGIEANTQAIYLAVTQFARNVGPLLEERLELFKAGRDAL